MARYKELRQILTNQIVWGMYAVGTRFPIEYQLRDRHAFTQRLRHERAARGPRIDAQDAAA